MSDFVRSIALVVGIDAYDHGIPPLRTARRDAERLAQLLAEQHGYDVRLLVDADATAERLLQLLTHELPAELKSTDRLLFYFAGHGVALDGDGGANGYLLMHDAKRGQETTYLHMPRVHDALLALECRHLLVILDACFAGAFRWSSTRDLVQLPPVIHQERFERFLASPAWQVITSAAADQTALDQLFIGSLGSRGGDDAPHSPFAQVLFAALEGAGDMVPVKGGDGVITATELYLYIEDRLQPETLQRGMQQTPRLWPLRKHDKGEFIFLVPGHELNLPPAPPLSFENNPYLGLRSYDDADSELFFGRGEVIRELGAHVEQHPFTVVLGASGTGKSSVVKAGLLPQLRKQPDTVVLPVQRPGTAPLQALRRAAAALGSDAASAEADDVVFLNAVRNWCATHSGSRLVLVIDQLEELITQAREPALSRPAAPPPGVSVQAQIHNRAAPMQRDVFMHALTAALDTCGDALRVVCTLRSDFEPQLSGGTLADRWEAARYIIRPMTQDELRQVIEQPASKRVLYFEPSSLVDVLINEVVATPGGLPLLSFALSEMYSHYVTRRSAERAITLDDYRAVGGVIGALRARAEAEFASLDAAHQATMRRVMLRMVAPAEGDAARRRVPRSELIYDDPAENTRVAHVIERLAAARLIVEDHEEGGEPYIEPAHDALVNAWDRLLGWIREENRSALHDLRFQRRLAPAAREWALFADQRARDALLWRDAVRGSLLAQLKLADNIWLNAQERAFVRRSLRARRRSRMALVATAILISGLAIGASVAALFATRNARRAADESAGARAALLGRTAAALPAEETDDAFAVRLLLAAEAVRLGTTTSDRRRIGDAESVIRQLAPQYAGVGLTGFMDTYPRQLNTAPWHLFSPDGRWLVTGHRSATEAYLWDLESASPAIPAALIDSAAYGLEEDPPLSFRGGWLVLRPSGDSLPTSGIDLSAPRQGVRPWPAALRQPGPPPAATDTEIWRIEQANDGVALRHTATDRTISVPGATDLFLVHGDRVAASTEGGVGVWSLGPDGAQKLYTLAGAVAPVAWSADGSWLVTRTGEPPDPLIGFMAPHESGELEFWSLAAQPVRVWAEAWGLWEEPVSSPDGRFFLRPGSRTHRLIDTRQFSLPDARRITAGAWAADGRVFVTGHEDGSLRSWIVAGDSAVPGPKARLDSAGEPIRVIRAAAGAGWILTLNAPGIHAIWRLDGDSIQYRGRLDTDSVDAGPDPLLFEDDRGDRPPHHLRGFSFRGDTLLGQLAGGRTGQWLLPAVARTGWMAPTVVAGGSAAPAHADSVLVSPDGRWRATGCAAFSPDSRWLFLEADEFYPTSSIATGRAAPSQPDTLDSGCRVRAATPPDAAPFTIRLDSTYVAPEVEGVATMRDTFSPDGRWVLLHMAFNTFADCGSTIGVRLLDLHAPDPLLTVVTLTGAGVGRCPEIHFSPDGAWLATDTVLWDLAGAAPARERFSLPGFALGFDSTSRFLAVRRETPSVDEFGESNAPTSFAIVPLDPAALVRQACRAAGRNLTRAEWRTYFPREPYRAVCEELPVPPLRTIIR